MKEEQKRRNFEKILLGSALPRKSNDYLGELPVIETGKINKQGKISPTTYNNLLAQEKILFNPMTVRRMEEKQIIINRTHEVTHVRHRVTVNSWDLNQSRVHELPNGIEYRYVQAIHTALRSSIYNISGKFAEFRVRRGTDPETLIRIPTSNYEGVNAIYSAVKRELDTAFAPAVFTLSTDPVTFGCQISASPNITISFDPNDSLLYILGFRSRRLNLTIGNSGNILRAEQPFDLSTLKTYCFNIREIQPQNISYHSGSDGCVSVITSSHAPGSVARDSMGIILDCGEARKVKQLTFDIYEYPNNKLLTTDDSLWSITLEFWL